MSKLNIFLLMGVAAMTGCSSVDIYPVSGSYAQIKEKQILDPMAPKNNAGVVNDLEGNYGKKVIGNYQKSAVNPAEGKNNSGAGKIISSGSSN